MKCVISRRPLGLFALLAAVVAVASVLVAKRVSGAVDEALLGVGAAAMAFPGGLVDQPRTVLVNGVGVSIRTQVVSAPLAHVVRHYRGVCGATPPSFSAYEALVASLATRSGTGSDDAYVACVDFQEVDFTSLTGRFQRFAKSSDLSHLGALRFAYARRAHEHPNSRTFVFTMWVDGSFPLGAFLPTEHGDAPGTDPEGFPRLANTQRLLSAREIFAPGALFIYESTRSSPMQLLKRYRALFPKHGWSLIERAPGEAVEIDGVAILAAQRENRQATVLMRSAEHGATILILLMWEAQQ